MPFEMVSAEEIQKIMDEEVIDSEESLAVMQEIISMAKGDFTIFYNKEDGRYFAIAKGTPIPYYMRDIILGNPSLGLHEVL